MEYTAIKSDVKSSKEEKISQYELFSVNTVRDIEDVKRQIPVSVGFFTLEILEQRKADLQSKIKDIESKIAAIKTMK